MKRLVLAATLVLAACGDPTKEDLLAKAEGVQDKATLRAKLGAPQDIAKFGPLETWTYRAKNGEVVFLIAGDNVALQAAGSAKLRE